LSSEKKDDMRKCLPQGVRLAVQCKHSARHACARTQAGAGHARTLLVARTPRKANSPAATAMSSFPCAPEKPSTRASGRAKPARVENLLLLVEPMTCQFLRGKRKLCEEKRCGHVCRAITTQPRAQAHGNSTALHRGIGRFESPCSIVNRRKWGPGRALLAKTSSPCMDSLIRRVMEARRDGNLVLRFSHQIAVERHAFLSSPLG
jgi:hypothetical protein